jgi:hypothetical protein
MFSSVSSLGNFSNNKNLYYNKHGYWNTFKNSATSSTVANFGYLRSMVLDTSRNILYIGGNFTNIGGRIASLNLYSSNFIDISGVGNNVGGYVNSISLDISNNIIYVGGAFTAVNRLTTNYNVNQYIFSYNVVLIM